MMITFFDFSLISFPGIIFGLFVGRSSSSEGIIHVTLRTFIGIRSIKDMNNTVRYICL